MYSLFKFEQLHSFHLEASGVLKEGAVFYFSSETAVTRLSDRKAEPKPLVQISNAVIRGSDVRQPAFDIERETLS